MMAPAKAVVTLLAIIMSAAPAPGCIPPPPIAQLPGESPQAFHERQEAFLISETYENRRLSQAAMLDQADSVFVGTISASRQIPVGTMKGNQVVVRPLEPIKGALPAHPVTVSDTAFTDCAMLVGGGSATTARPGDYVIVFTGLPTNAIQGADVGILAKEAQLPELLSALSKYALEHRSR